MFDRDGRPYSRVELDALVRRAGGRKFGGMGSRCDLEATFVGQSTAGLQLHYYPDFGLDGINRL